MYEWEGKVERTKEWMYVQMQQSGRDDLADAGTFLMGAEVDGAGMAMALS